MSRKNLIICLVFAVWTVIQTGFHLVPVVYAYFLGSCYETPTDSRTIFFYLTYLYNSHCPKPNLGYNDNASQLQAYVLTIADGLYPANSTFSLEEVVRDLLLKLNYFPDYVGAFSRTSVFMLCFIILDGTWIVSAVALAMGVCFGIKGALSLFFYGPWLVMTACMCLFDITTGIIFALDISATASFSNWLSFVGISQTSEFDDILNKHPPTFISPAPSVVLSLISGRFLFIWLANWVGFVLVMRATISVYRETYKNQAVPNRPQRTFRESPSNRNRVDQNTSADRIRNWQLFYGAIDATSTGSSRSSQAERDGASNSRESQGENSSNGSDVFVGDTGAYLEELRGQLPWSYTRPEGESRGRTSKEERIQMENRTGRHNSDSSLSGTEI